MKWFLFFDGFWTAYVLFEIAASALGLPPPEYTPMTSLGFPFTITCLFSKHPKNLFDRRLSLSLLLWQLSQFSAALVLGRLDEPFGDFFPSIDGSYLMPILFFSAGHRGHISASTTRNHALCNPSFFLAPKSSLASNDLP